MEALFQKNLLGPDFPFRLSLGNGIISFPHHWHDEIEIVYVIEGEMSIGINNKLYTLRPKDIIIISSGDIHYFLDKGTRSQWVLMQFGLSIFDNLTSSTNDRRFIRHLFNHSKRMSDDWGSSVHSAMEKQIQLLVDEYNNSREGYKLALKARLYDLVVILLRQVPTETSSDEEDSRQREKLKRLESVFQYVENNFSQSINLEDAAAKAGFSLYHFTRFFKECIGITFCQYLSNYRITRAEWFLMNDEDSITEIAFKAGFNSVKTFNRIFKNNKGCSPSEYIKKQNMRDS